MKERTTPLPHCPFSLRLLELFLPQDSFVVLDIETTGLSPSSCACILSGMVTVEAGEAIAIQLFAETPDQEPQVLARTFELLEAFPYVVTYNGQGFDIPFLQARGQKHGLTMPARYNLDLYQMVRKGSDLRALLPNLKQKTVEAYMGLSEHRQDQIDGGESVRLYEQYVQHPQQRLEDLILLHNRDDICQLYHLLPILRQVDIPRAIVLTGLPIPPAAKRIATLAPPRIQKGQLSLQGTLTSGIDYIGFPTEPFPASVRMSRATSTWEAEIPLESVEGALVLDAARLLAALGDALPEYPAFAQGYLIVRYPDKTIPYLELALFLQAFCQVLDRL